MNLRTNTILILLFLFLLVSCDPSETSKQANNQKSIKMEANTHGDEEKEIIKLKGFDFENEPEIRIMKDGSMYAVFNFMPPEEFKMKDSDFENFDREMQAAVGVEVIWEDREFFLIPKPNEDTVGKLKDFIENYKIRKGY